MAKIAIIGTGDVGATLAYTLELSGLATELVLVDINKETARGHALDMNHGLFFTPPVRIYAGDYKNCAGAEVVIITAGARQRQGESRLELVQRNAAIIRSIMDQLLPVCPDAIFLMATNPVDVMTYVAQAHSGLPIGQVFGSGTVLDSARFRYTLSERFEVDARNVHAYVIGEHGDSEVLLWSSVNISGIPLEMFCDDCQEKITPAARHEIEEIVRRSAYHIIEAKGFTNYGVSVAIQRILGAIIRDEHSILTVSTRLTGEYNLDDVCVSVPCLVSKQGVVRVIETQLSDDEQLALKKSAGIIRDVIGKL
ncbi:L-lactate dehydrogenase [candidate division KSB1 bacterium]|nr:L-lactate dehydrogenase [candidate division KSB1 bacterium]